MEDSLFDFIEMYMPLTADEKNALASMNLFQQFKKGAVLLQEGQRSKRSYFVLKGCIRTYYVVNGEEKTTAFYTEMEGLTPVGVLQNEPSEYYVSCVEDVVLTVFTPDMEAEMFARFPRFETLCRVMSEQLLAKNQRSFDAFKTSSPEERYLDLVQNRPDLVHRVPQHQLASFLGITPESLSRLRARLAAKKKKTTLVS